MKSQTIPSFWKAYSKLSEIDKSFAKKAFHLWKQDPTHPSLQFKRINRENNLWSVRISKSHRAIALRDGETATWIWIGNHDDFASFFGS